MKRLLVSYLSLYRQILIACLIDNKSGARKFTTRLQSSLSLVRRLRPFAESVNGAVQLAGASFTAR
jgi:hypothetical protein